MIKYHKTPYNIVIAELKDDRIIIGQTQEVLNVICDLASYSCRRIIINEKNFHNDFFQLKTGLAGEILQKFSNYNVKLAIVGDFSKYESKSLKDFIRESNKGNMIYFVDSLDSALIRLSKKMNCIRNNKIALPLRNLPQGKCLRSRLAPSLKLPPGQFF